MTDSYSLRAYVFTNFAGQESREIRWIFQSKGCRAVLQSRSTREVVILIQYSILYQSLTTLSSKLCSLVITALYKYIKTNDKKPTTERLNINQVILTKPHIGVIVHQGPSFSTPFRWAFLLQTVTIKHLIISHIICNLQCN